MTTGVFGRLLGLILKPFGGLAEMDTLRFAKNHKSF